MKIRLCFTAFLLFCSICLGGCTISPYFYDPSADDIDGIWQCDDPYMYFNFQSLGTKRGQGVMEVNGKIEDVTLGPSFGNWNWYIYFTDTGETVVSGHRWRRKGDNLFLYGEKTYVLYLAETKVSSTP